MDLVKVSKDLCCQQHVSESLTCDHFCNDKEVISDYFSSDLSLSDVHQESRENAL